MNILLKKSDIFEVKDDFFLINKGKIFVKKVFTNGKVISYNLNFGSGDIIGDFLKLLPAFNSNPLNLNFTLEVTALEDTELEKIETPFLISDSTKLTIHEKIITQLLKKQVLHLLYFVFPKQLYILAVLALMSKRGLVEKADIRPENFNMSRSQFYNLFNNIKKESFFIELKNQFLLDIDKINNTLNEFFI